MKESLTFCNHEQSMQERAKYIEGKYGQITRVFEGLSNFHPSIIEYISDNRKTGKIEKTDRLGLFVTADGYFGLIVESAFCRFNNNPTEFQRVRILMFNIVLIKHPESLNIKKVETLRFKRRAFKSASDGSLIIQATGLIQSE